VLLYWVICEKRYLKGSHSDEYKELSELLAKLCSHIIEFQATAICHLSQEQLSRARSDVTGGNDWEGKTATINALSEQYSNMIPHLQAGENKEKIDRVIHEMQQLRAILEMKNIPQAGNTLRQFTKNRKMGIFFMISDPDTNMKAIKTSFHGALMGRVSGFSRKIL